MAKKISERRESASSLPARYAGAYRQLVHSLPFGLAVLHLVDPSDTSTWRLIAVNDAASRIAGSSVAGLLNLPLAARERGRGKHPGSVAQICRHVATSNRTAAAGHLNFAMTGTRQFFELSIVPLGGNCVAVLLQDVTLLRDTTRELIGTKWQTAQICESARSILWRAHPVTLEFTYVTPDARQILGYWIERWLHESNFWKKLVHPEDWSQVEESCARAAEGAKLHFECRILSAQGEIRRFRIHVQRAELPFGRTELAGVMIDITDQKRAEEGLRELSTSILRAQEEERKTISRELHESVGQHLTGLNYALGRLGRSRAGSEQMREILRECVETVQTCMKEIRSVSYMLRPPLLDLLGLGPALRSFAEKFSQESGVQVEIDIPRETVPLDADAQVVLYRIAHECLTNIQRQGRAKSARIRMAWELANVVLEVQEYVTGANANLPPNLEAAGEPDLLLLKMRQQVTDLKGELDIQSNGGGTAIRVKIPSGIGRGAPKDLMREQVPSMETRGRVDLPRLVRSG